MNQERLSTQREAAEKYREFGVAYIPIQFKGKLPDEEALRMSGTGSPGTLGNSTVATSILNPGRRELLKV